MRTRTLLSDKQLLRVVWLCAAVCVVCAWLLLFAGCAASRTGKALNVAVIGSGVADLVTTSHAMDRGGREWNRIAGDEEWRQWLVKSLGVSGVIGAAALLDRKEHRILAHVLRGAVAGVYTWASIHNHGVNRNKPVPVLMPVGIVWPQPIR